MRQIAPSYGAKSKYPEWVVLVVSTGGPVSAGGPDGAGGPVSTDGQGRANVMPVGWAMYVSSSPLLFAVAIHHRQHTNKLIQETGEFVVSVPGPGMEEIIRYCGSHSGRDVDKIAVCGIQTAPASRVKPPLLIGARTNLECVLSQAVEAGDHTVFIGEIVAAWEDDTVPGRLMNFGEGLFALAQPTSDDGDA